MIYLDSINLSLSFKSYLEQITTGEYYKKGQIILSPGTAGQKVWLIDKGMAKMFSYTEDGKQSINYFFGEGEAMACVESFFDNQKSNSYIEILEDSYLYALTKTQFEECFQKFSEAHDLSIYILLAYKHKSDQRAELLSLPAKERYRCFIKQYNAMRLSVNDLSSYLHLAPTYLSVIRQSA